MLMFPFGPWQKWLHQMNLDWLVDWIKDVQSEVNGKQDELTAGENITIEDNVISSTGGGGGSTYTAGTGIDITNNVISVVNAIIKTPLNFEDADIPCLFLNGSGSPTTLLKEDGTTATLSDCLDLGTSALDIGSQFLRHWENVSFGGNCKVYDYATQEQTETTYSGSIQNGTSQVYTLSYDLFTEGAQIIQAGVTVGTTSVTLQIVIGKSNGRLYACVINQYYGTLSQQSYLTSCTLNADIEFTQI